MFSRVLVANRGEIAVRVIRALHELGIEAVAVYSTADADAAHVRMADRAVCIGPPAPGESYLNIPSIVAAANTTGCEAVHPGYGFLAERPEFVRACTDNDLVFVGPDADVMAQMGDKVQAKAAMRAAGVPLVPGTDEATTLEQAKQLAPEVGFPVLLKAAAGGGGRGMRLVHDPAELEDAYNTASAEAQAAFGDGSLYLEKALVPARHVEIQVLADASGVLTLGERECSIQRRHQKLIEESPSPALTPETREEMEAVRRARLPRDRLHERGHARVPARGGRELLLHRAERPAAGRASRSPSSSRESTSSASSCGSPPASRCRRPGERRVRATRSRSGSTPRIRRTASPRRPGRSRGCAPPAARGSGSTRTSTPARRSRRTTTR